jgi:signal transduction histidine kinase
VEWPWPADLSDLESVIQPMRDAGLGVELIVTGRPRRLPRAVEQCAVRVVREALTNVLRHAGPVQTRVTVGYGGEQLAVTVTNPAGRPGIRPPGDGGEGLRDMRERVELLGGRFSVAFCDGRFSVDVTLPTRVPSR